jgi:hypothetical protein
MPKTPLAALAASIILLGAMLGSRVCAMTIAPSSTLGVAPDATLLHRATVICGSNGCAPVQTKRVQHPKKLQYIR